MIHSIYILEAKLAVIHTETARKSVRIQKAFRERRKSQQYACNPLIFLGFRLRVLPGKVPRIIWESRETVHVGDRVVPSTSLPWDKRVMRHPPILANRRKKDDCCDISIAAAIRRQQHPNG